MENSEYNITTTKTMERESSSHDDEEAEEPPPSFSLATLGLQRVGTAPPPKPQPQQPIQTLNARGMPARIRKRNRLFFDDNIINDDKPLRMSLSPRKVMIKIPSPSKTPIKVLKKGKGISSRYMRVPEKVPKVIKAKKEASPPIALKTPKQTNIASSIKHLSINDSIAKPTNKIQPSLKAITEDTKIGQRIGLRLRNLLKLPKAHRWVIFEWFYSFIDQPLFDCQNEFQLCIRDSFPCLRTENLTKAEWQKIRSLLGKPRRCSPAFFAEERRELERKRQKMRYVQTQRSCDPKNALYMYDLPDKIPLPLPVGTKVTARLREPQDGIFGGTVDAFDSVTSTYRVTFDRPGLGTHSVPDYEIVSENFREMISIQSITKDFRPNLINIYHGTNSGTSTPSHIATGTRNTIPRNVVNSALNKSDPLLGQEVIENPFRNPIIGRENINGYPLRLLENMIRLRRALTSKKLKLQRLSDMNNDAELRASQLMVASRTNSVSSLSDDTQHAVSESSPQLGDEFQRRYASIIITMERMNHDIQDYLNEVQLCASELSRDPQIQAMLTPSYLREKCREAATDAVARNNHVNIKSEKLLNLTKNLATVLLVASHLSNDNSIEVNKVLEGCVEEVRSSLYNCNIETFQKQVQIHLHHIRLGIGQSMMISSPNSINKSTNVSQAKDKQNNINSTINTVNEIHE